MGLKKHFPGQHPDETIFRVIHRHWFNIATHFVAITFAFFAVILCTLSAPFLSILFDFSLSPSLLFFISTLTLLFLWLYAFFIWIDYYFDVWVITNERVLNVEQKGLFTRVVSEVHMGRVQDVTTKVEGFLPTLLNYGDIFIQTAGEEKYFHFRNVGEPNTHKDEIVQLVKEFQEKHAGARPSSDGL